MYLYIERGVNGESMDRQQWRVAFMFHLEYFHIHFFIWKYNHQIFVYSWEVCMEKIGIKYFAFIWFSFFFGTEFCMISSPLHLLPDPGSSGCPSWHWARCMEDEIPFLIYPQGATSWLLGKAGQVKCRDALWGHGKQRAEELSDHSRKDCGPEREEKQTNKGAWYSGPESYMSFHLGFCLLSRILY